MKASLEAALAKAVNDVVPGSGKALPDILLGLAENLNRQADLLESQQAGNDAAADTRTATAAAAAE